MDTWVWLILLFLALGLGAAVGWLAARSRGSIEREKEVALAREDAANAKVETARTREELAQLRRELAEALARHATYESRLSDDQTELAKAQAQVAQARSEVAEARADTARAEAKRDAAVQRMTEILADRTELKEQFAALSAKSLDEQGKQTRQQLLEPVTQGLRLLNERIGAVEKERIQAQAELREQLSQMLLSGEQLRKETLSLSNALRTPQIRGSWGEQSLRRMVEISGLTDRVDFDEQVSQTSAEGTLQRPDMRIRLADNKVIFVDAKVPLAAVLEAYNTEDEAKQAEHLARFARHVRGHIDALASKNYWELDLGSPEFVVLFLGSDEFYRLAQEQMPDLHDYAARHSVMLASPGILIPMLHIVAHGWSQAALAESATKIAALGKELHKRLATMGEHFTRMGRGLTQAVDSYNKGIASLERRVLVSARRFDELDLAKENLTELSGIDALPALPSAPELTEPDISTKPTPENE